MFLQLLHSRYLRPLIFLAIVGLFFTVPSLFHPSSSILNEVCGIEDPTSCSSGSSHSRSNSASSSSNELNGIRIDLGKIIENVKLLIDENAKSFDENYYRNELGFKIKYEDLESYKKSLVSIWDNYFTSSSSSSSTAELEEILSYLSLSNPSPLARKEGSSKNIYTTSLDDPNDLPEQFKSWSTINPDWSVRFVSDNGIDEWLEALLPGSEVVNQLKWLKEGDKWGVVRSDLFRYLVLLLNGGVYTDTDTACVRSIPRWGNNAITHHSNIPLLEAIPQLVSLSQEDHSSHDYHQQQSEDNVQVKDDNSPSLIVALEIDAPASGTDWRSETFVRGIQIVQWTIASKKGHPIFLDVIGHALNKVRELREIEEKGWINDESQDILEWSGPGAFTDAVFRYLLIRYGFHPRQVSGLDRPLRIGDVLIMPVHSFRADASEGDQGDNHVVWHGFFGRWKGDK